MLRKQRLFAGGHAAARGTKGKVVGIFKTSLFKNPVKNPEERHAKNKHNLGFVTLSRKGKGEKNSKEQSEMYTKALALAASARAKTAAARAAKAPIVLLSKPAPASLNQMERGAGITAPAPPCPLQMKNRFLRSVPETQGTYRHDGKHVQGALRRKLLWLILAEKYAMFSQTMKKKKNKPAATMQVLFVSMSSSLNDEEIYFQRHSKNLTQYKRATMKFLRGLRCLNAGYDDKSHDDPFADLQVAMRDERIQAREEFERLLREFKNKNSQDISSNRGNKLDAVQTADASTLGYAVQSAIMDSSVSITALSVEHQLFSHCCALHANDSDGIVRDDAVAMKYAALNRTVLACLRRVESSALLVDMITGTKHLRDVLTTVSEKKR